MQDLGTTARSKSGRVGATCSVEAEGDLETEVVPLVAKQQPPPVAAVGAVVPASVGGYLRSMGPGVVMALTWLGAGDLVDAAVAGGEYGYALTWAMAMAFFVRFVFVSLLAKYQLCNARGESVVCGMARMHPAVAGAVGAIAVVFGHANNSYMIRGVGETFGALVRWGPPWFWSTFWVVAAAFFTFCGRAQYYRLERLFYVFLAVLSCSLVGVAAWSGPDFGRMASGLFLLEVPAAQSGDFSVLLVVVSLIGAVGGSAANLMYPMYIHEKGWRGPQHRRVQLYDLAFGTIIVVILDLAVWSVGAELLHPKSLRVSDLKGLAQLLTLSLGPLGGPVFYLGAFAALLSSVVGSASGYGLLVAEVARVLDCPRCCSCCCCCGAERPTPPQREKRTHPLEMRKDEEAAIYAGSPASHHARAQPQPQAAAATSSVAFRMTAAWCLVSPLVWSSPGAPNFVALTVFVNALNVVILPFLTIAVWVLTSSRALIGDAARNRWWEHAVLAGLTALSVWAAGQSLRSLLAA